MRSNSKFIRNHIYRKDVLFDASGAKVDISGDVWELNDPTTRIRLDWKRIPITSFETMDATKHFIRAMIASNAPKSVSRAFDALKLLNKSSSFVKADENDDEIQVSFFVEVRNYLGSEGAYRLHDIRQWFQFCCDYGASAFSPEVAFYLSERVIGGNKKGFKVLSVDPRDGPLDDTELAHVIAALKSRTKAVNQINEVDLAIWLMLALGCNPAQLALWPAPIEWSGCNVSS